MWIVVVSKLSSLKCRSVVVVHQQVDLEVQEEENLLLYLEVKNCVLKVQQLFHLQMTEMENKFVLERRMNFWN